MATQTFSKSGSTITINGYSTDNPPHYKIEADNSNHLVLINADDNSFNLQVNAALDTITINGESFSGTATELRTALLADIFANSGSGGSGAALEGDVNYYVSPSGSDSNSGTDESPFATIQHALDLIPKNLNGCYANVFLKDGTYNEALIDVAHFTGVMGELQILSQNGSANVEFTLGNKFRVYGNLANVYLQGFKISGTNNLWVEDNPAILTLTDIVGLLLYARVVTSTVSVGNSSGIYFELQEGSMLQETAGNSNIGITWYRGGIHSRISDGKILSPHVMSSENYANDTAAGAAGIRVGDLYHTDGAVKIRLT